MIFPLYTSFLESNQGAFSSSYGF